MAAERGAAAGQAVAVVIQGRIADEAYAAFTLWTGKVAEALKSWPDFLGMEVVPPRPPTHIHWVRILRFAAPAAAQSWLQSDEHARLVEEMRPYCVGGEDIHILPEADGHSAASVAAFISFNVPPEREAEFLAWQARVQKAEAEFQGFLRHKIERPNPGLHDDWIVILSFDNDANLTRWIDSPQRLALLEEGRAFNAGLTVRRSSYGFNFWFPNGQKGSQGPGFVFKSNLIVLLVLYPVVFLWGYFIGRPLIDSHGVPFWLSLFIGNVASTQLLGWWIAPAAFRALDWWIKPHVGWQRNLLGYGLIICLYALSMAVYAGLLAWNWGHPLG
ncbi:MAG: hypothetical protein AB7O80_13725 [Acetobacteraceae bacterium]